MDKISVLICDDSALMRNLVSRIVDGVEGLEVAGTALNGMFCLQKIPVVKPDVIILDIEMPVMNGIEFLKERKTKGIDVPVIILSSVAKEGAAVTMEALELGASDFITKPGGSISMDIAKVTNDLVELIASYGGMYARKHGKSVWDTDYFMRQVKMHEAEQFVAKQKGTVEKADFSKKEPSAEPQFYKFSQHKEEAKTPSVVDAVRQGGRIDVIALGISTGGPNALREVFRNLSPELKQPILVVQHMPAGFTAEFANSLNKICPLEVEEAKDGAKIQNGHVYIAPGDNHIYVEPHIDANVLRLSKDPPMNGHRPSAGYLFKSVAKVYQNHAMGVIMTGMGRDGASEIAEMRKEGAWTLGQDEHSSVVYGMPKVAWELGGVQKQVALDKMADAINELAREHLK